MSRGLMMLSMMMAMAAQNRSLFDTGMVRPADRKMDKGTIHKLYGENRAEHEFIIKGEKIMAKDKKTAMKIYTNRHGGSKKKKKK